MYIKVSIPGMFFHPIHRMSSYSLFKTFPGGGHSILSAPISPLFITLLRPYHVLFQSLSLMLESKPLKTDPCLCKPVLSISV